MLSAISEPVVGAAVVRSYAVEARTQARIDEAVAPTSAASTRAQGFTAFSFSLGGVSAGLANAGVLIVGIWLGFAGDITAGKVLAFAFLVTLFVGPVQLGTQILTDAQNAIAGWRRVIGILETPADLVDPGPDGPRRCRAGRSTSASSDVEFAYPGGPAGAARRRPRHRRRPPGRDRRRDRLGQVDVRQAAHPADGPVARARCCSTASTSARSPRPRCARSVVLVPQEGFLFDDTIAANVRYGRLDATEAEILASADELGLGDWVAGLPAGLDTRVGQRGESLSAGERQLVALLRAHLADPDLLVLDEATSAVDPQLEMRIGRALERADVRAHVGDHRPPALHRRERRRGRRRRPGPDRAARPARRAGRAAPTASTPACTRRWVSQQGRAA